MTNIDAPVSTVQYTVGSLHKTLRLVYIIASGPARA